MYHYDHFSIRPLLVDRGLVLRDATEAHRLLRTRRKAAPRRGVDRFTRLLGRSRG